MTRAANVGKTPSRIEGLRLHLTVPPEELAYCTSRAALVGGVPDVLIECVRDVRTLFDLPPDQFALLDAERTSLGLEQRDYLRLILSHRYLRLGAEGQKFSRRPEPLPQEVASRTSVNMPLADVKYLEGRARAARSTQLAIVGAVHDVLTFYDLPPDQYELLSGEWATLATERFAGSDFGRREYLRFCVSEHFQLLHREPPPEGSPRTPPSKGGRR